MVEAVVIIMAAEMEEAVAEVELKPLPLELLVVLEQLAKVMMVAKVVVTGLATMMLVVAAVVLAQLVMIIILVVEQMVVMEV